VVAPAGQVALEDEEGECEADKARDERDDGEQDLHLNASDQGVTPGNNRNAMATTSPMTMMVATPMMPRASGINFS
jgi:hypothetical protein